MAAGMSRPTPGNQNIGMVMLILNSEIYVVVEVCALTSVLRSGVFFTQKK